MRRPAHSWARCAGDDALDTPSSCARALGDPVSPRRPRHPPIAPTQQPEPEIELPSALTHREHILVGEAAFSDGDAELGYQQLLAVIVADPDAELAPFALHKLSWAEYTLGDLDAALSDMRLVAAWLVDDDRPRSQQNRNEALADVARFEDEADDAP